MNYLVCTGVSLLVSLIIIKYMNPYKAHADRYRLQARKLTWTIDQLAGKMAGKIPCDVCGQPVEGKANLVVRNDGIHYGHITCVEPAQGAEPIHEV